jgi:hypothetical protein
LSQVQAKETVDIPEEEYEIMRAEIKKQRWYDLSKITFVQIKYILKRTHLTRYYEHASYIRSKLTGMPPPLISREAEEKIKSIFKLVQKLYVKFCPNSRTNFFSYAYFLHKVCQLLELDELLPYFTLLRNPTKLRVQDGIWRKICLELRYQFIPSI